MSTPQNTKILLVDDEADILRMLEYNLSNEGFEVLATTDPKKGLELALSEKPELMILDIMMPGMDGVELCTKMRAHPSLDKSLIVFLTARSEDFSQIAGLDSGADDYLTKPLSPKVFLAKVKSLLKRTRQAGASMEKIMHNGLMVDFYKHQVLLDGNSIHFPKKEFDLLALFIDKPGRVFTREEIFKNVWGEDHFVGDRTIDVHVRKVREKIGSDKIVTVKGVGYKFAE